MATLRHPSIVEVYEYGIEQERSYFTMELLVGRDLRKVSPLEPIEACRILRDLAAAVAFLHAHGLIHGDLSPGNVRCALDGRAKLIDFGVVASVGTSTEVAGTPGYIAPEIVRGLPCDHRVDLYGLGALAYRLLTGRSAYAAPTIADLEQAWVRPLEPPSAVVPHLPRELDRLVLALLAEEPLARPATAAEVVDRLTEIGGLPPLTEPDVAPAYLSSAALIGRDQEIATLRLAIEDARRGRGSAVILEAPSGTGKSRLLREAALEAQLAGATVIEARSEEIAGAPYGIMRALGRSLLRVAREPALMAAERSALLARVIPELRSSPGQVPPDPHPAGSPAEDRMRVQEALLDWLCAIASERTLAIVIDDFQRCDEASAAVLTNVASAASSREIVCLFGLRTDEAARATGPITALQRVARRMPLVGLDREDTRRLLIALFGDLPGVPLLGERIYEWSSGNPLCCMELARHLVERGAIRYSRGGWHISSTFSRVDLPRGVLETISSRLGQLSERALQLGEALSVHGAELPLELCAAVLDDVNDDELFAALDELCAAGVLLRRRDYYRFSHDGLREALLSRMSAERRRDLHLRVGTILAQRFTPDREVEIGWHLVRGGAEEAGADLLARAGIRLFDCQSMPDAIGPLEQALAIYEKLGRPRVDCLGLRRRLIIAGTYCNIDVALKLADATLDELACASGLELALPVGRVLGMRAGIAIGLVFASVVRWFSPRGCRGPRPRDALRDLATLAGYVATSYAAALEYERLERLCASMKPFSALEGTALEALWLAMRGMLCVARMDYTEFRRCSDRALALMEADRTTPITDVDRRSALAGMRISRAYTLVFAGDPRDELAALERLGMRAFDAGRMQVETLYHRWRGDEDRARELERAAELVAVQLGSFWGMQAVLVTSSGFAYGQHGDIRALARSIDRLDDLIAAGLPYHGVREVLRAEHARLAGRLAEAREILDRLLARVRGHQSVEGLAGQMVEIDLAVDEGNPARAIELAKAMASADLIPRIRFRIVEAWARAEAELGDPDRADERIDGLLAEAETMDNPAAAARLLVARARIAAAAGETSIYEDSLASLEHIVLQLRNPVLIAQAEAVRRVAPVVTVIQPPRPEVLAAYGLAADTDVDSISGKGPAGPGA